MKANRNKSAAYKRLFSSYCLVLLIPLIIVIICTIFYSSQFKKEVLRSNKAQVTNAVEVFNSSISKMDLATDQILYSATLSNLLDSADFNSPESLTNPLKRPAIWSLQKTMLFTSQMVNHLEDLFLYFPQQDYVISRHISMMRPTYFSNFLSADSDELTAEMNKTFPRRYLPMGDHLAIISSLPVNQVYDRSIKMVMILDSAMLFEQINTTNSRYNGFSIILTGNNEFVYSSRDDLNISDIHFSADSDNSALVNGEKYTYAQGVSGYNQWKYYSFVENVQLFRTTRHVAVILLSLFIAAILIGILTIHFVSSHVFRPLRILENHADEKGNFRALEAAMEKVITDEQQIKDELERQKPFIQKTFIHHLISNHFRSNNQLCSEMESTGMDLSAPLYCGIILKFERECMDEDAQKLLQHSFPNIYLVNTEPQLWGGVIKSDSEELSDFKLTISAAADRLQTIFKSLMDCRIALFCGSITTNLLSVHISHNQAKYMMDSVSYRTFSDLPVCQFFDNTWQKADNYYYPAALETRIIESVVSGNCEELKKSLNYIYHENFITNGMSMQGQRLLSCRLASTAICCAERLESTDKELYESSMQQLANSFRSANLYGTFKEITFIIKTMAESVQSKQASGLSIKHQLIDYISRNYASPDICLDTVSSAFNVTSTYLSSLFKDQVGQTFSEYLEMTRLDKAVELLLSARKDVETISQEVGYNNSRTFRRAFKRVYGVSPKDYIALKENCQT